ncbi:MAG TPA: hypothetical protein VFH73_11150 [Polyangia bacterium]|nr:hypothetical protein [Polyangia bacterium]
MKRAPLAIVTLLGWCLSSPAWSADEGATPPAAAKARAQASLRDGNTWLEKGRPNEALAKFTEAYALFPSPKIHYNIGQAHGLIPGHEAPAYEALARFLTEAHDASPELRAAAEAQLQTLRPKLGLVTVVAEIDGADLLVDGASLGTTPRTTPVVLGPGAHMLSLRKDAAIGPTRTITIAGGDSTEVRLGAPATTIATIPAPPPVASGPAMVAESVIEAKPASDVFWTGRRKIGAVLVGLAVATLTFGIVEHVRYFGTKDDFVKAGCYVGVKDKPCPDLESQFHSTNIGWVIGYGAAVVLGASSAYLLSVSQ